MTSPVVTPTLEPWPRSIGSRRPTRAGSRCRLNCSTPSDRRDCSIWCATSPCSSSTRSPRSRRAPIWWRGAASARRTPPPSCATHSRTAHWSNCRRWSGRREDLALYRADMADWPGTGELRDWQRHRRDWVKANDATRRDILARLEASGTAGDARAPGHLRQALGVHRMDRQPQRRETPGLHGGAGRGRGRRTAGT